MDLDFEFDPSAVEPGTFDALPAGDVIAQIVESNVNLAKSGNGKVLAFTWEITEGDLTNRKFWQYLNYQHTNATAQIIGQQQLKAICEAVGIEGHLTDSEVLHNIPCRVRLGIDPKDNSRNVVKSVKPLQADAPATKAAVTKPAAQPATRSAQATTQAPKPATGQTRPWGNRKTA